MQMRFVPGSLFITITFFLIACAQLPQVPPSEGDLKKGGDLSSFGDDEITLWDSCTREQAEQWTSQAGADGRVAMKASSCYIVLINQGKDRSIQASDARLGRKLAEETAKRYPQSALAHYLAAYLTGLEAKFNPLHGLALVPIMEREALKAADLNPMLDHGGPDRMLGNLYLGAPGPPVSIGDSSRALIHFQRALLLDPDYPENRLGLVEALLAEEEIAGACGEWVKLLESMPPGSDHQRVWEKALRLGSLLCSQLSE